MNVETFSIKAPKGFSKRFAATCKGKFLTRVNSLSIPYEYFRVTFCLLPCKVNLTFPRYNNLGNVNFMLVLKGIFGGSLKITLQSKNNPHTVKKNNLKRFS